MRNLTIAALTVLLGTSVAHADVFLSAPLEDCAPGEVEMELESTVCTVDANGVETACDVYVSLECWTH